MSRSCRYVKPSKICVTYAAASPSANSPYARSASKRELSTYLRNRRKAHEQVKYPQSMGTAYSIIKLRNLSVLTMPSYLTIAAGEVSFVSL